MNASTKSALLLAGTLVVGLLLGAAGAGAIARQRRAELGAFGRPPGFARHVIDVIQPRDVAQTAQLQPAIERAAERNRRIIREANGGLRQSIDSLRAELAPLLDEAQRERISRMTRILPPFGPGRPRPDGFRPRGGGPPPFDRPSEDAGPPPR
ncbi:MAG: hypothetical protein JWL95_2428 [Gemmatimonadetes bacterium]|nr:hypothetical protein [Gemmatimonadota bacterium]